MIEGRLLGGCWLPAFDTVELLVLLPHLWNSEGFIFFRSVLEPRKRTPEGRGSKGKVK
jgi:hypothetical protein